MNTLWSAKQALPPRRNVVVSGIGLLSPLGLSSAESLSGLLHGRTAIQPPGNTLYEAAFQSTKFPLGLLPDRRVGMRDASLEGTQREARHTKIAMRSLRESLHDAGLDIYLDKTSRSNDNHFEIDKTRIGVNVGLGIPCLQDIYDCGKHVQSGAANKVSPFFVPKILGNTISGQISVQYGLQGGSHCVTSACTTGTHCIGEAFRIIERGDCDVMIAGAAESCIHEIATTGFHRLRALSHTTCRPFDASRDGFVIGEGGAVLILEEATHALNRLRELQEKPLSTESHNVPFVHRSSLNEGLPWYAEVIGYGTSSDGHHITAPHPKGTGCSLCMNRALVDAGISMSDVNAVFAHATGTMLGDEIELSSIMRARSLSVGTNQSHSPVPVVSVKGAIGHLLGAAGSVETALGILCAFHRRLPINHGLRSPIPHDAHFVTLPHEAESRELPSRDHRSIILKNSFGFGGTNASLVFSSKYAL